jgi:hypothetical protein
MEDHMTREANAILGSYEGEDFRAGPEMTGVSLLLTPAHPDPSLSCLTYLTREKKMLNEASSTAFLERSVIFMMMWP